MIERVVWIGSKVQGYEILKLMNRISPEKLMGAITIDDRNAQDARCRFNEIAGFCNDDNIKLYVVKTTKEFEDAIKELKPELGIVACWYWIIKKEILDIVPKGFIGIHNSLLPKYRGGSPLNWQIINDEKVVGFSVFSFVEDMDAGNIWHQEKVIVEDGDHVSDLLEKIENKTLNWFTLGYPLLLQESLRSFPQDHSKATYCAQRYPNDGVIDWNKASTEIYNFIRAQSFPYPGAFTYYKDKKLIILRAELKDVIYYGTPGQVARRDGGYVWVICGDQKPLILKTVQLEDEPENLRDASDVIKSIKDRL